MIVRRYVARAEGVAGWFLCRMGSHDMYWQGTLDLGEPRGSQLQIGRCWRCGALFS